MPCGNKRSLCPPWWRRLVRSKSTGARRRSPAARARKSVRRKQISQSNSEVMLWLTQSRQDAKAQRGREEAEAEYIDGNPVFCFALSLYYPCPFKSLDFCSL